MKGQSNKFIRKNGLQRVLRSNMTDAEKLLWQRLRHVQLGGHKFRRQHPFEDYILDFVCLESLLVIEVDGSQHQDSNKDMVRDERLSSAGFKVLRFWNNQITDEIDAVVENIWHALETHPHPNLPLEGEGVIEETK